jgi:hypothetical protein
LYFWCEGAYRRDVTKSAAWVTINKHGTDAHAQIRAQPCGSGGVR